MKYIEDIKFRKVKIKPLLFADDMIVYRENPKKQA